MTDVQFTNEPAYAPVSQLKQSAPLLALPQKLGLAKNDKEAQQVLIATIIGCMIIAGIAWFAFGRTETHSLSAAEYRAHAQNQQQYVQH